MDVLTERYHAVRHADHILVLAYGVVSVAGASQVSVVGACRSRTLLRSDMAMIRQLYDHEASDRRVQQHE
jgi:hypothetical protein